MPLIDLIHYFNRNNAIGDSTLYLEDERAAAWHEGLRLRSLFQPIVNLQTGRVIGHQAFLVAEDEEANSLDSDAAYRRFPSDESVVQFDRLCRTVHALNFLAQHRHAGGYLQLSVHPRHLLAVPSQHGLVFETILKCCGLAPVDIVLELKTNVDLDDAHFASAVENYRERGYRIALSSQGEHPELFAPDIVKYPVKTLRQPSFPAGALIHADNLDSAEDLEIAKAYGAKLGQGILFGNAARDCVSTHKPDGLAYNLRD